MNDKVGGDAMTAKFTLDASTMSEIEFAHLGGSEIAYIKSISADDAREMYPQLDGIPSGIEIFALHAADGTPLALTDSRFMAIANAHEHDLEAVSVH